MALVVVTQVEKRAQSGAVNRDRPIEGRPLTTPPYLTTSEACRRFHVSRGKLSQMRRDGLVQAINLNPGGERAVWRYLDRLEVREDLEGELRWQGLRRRCGL